MFLDHLLGVHYTDICNGPTNVIGNFDTLYFSCESSKKARDVLRIHMKSSKGQAVSLVSTCYYRCVYAKSLPNGPDGIVRLLLNDFLVFRLGLLDTVEALLDIW